VQYAKSSVTNNVTNAAKARKTKWCCAQWPSTPLVHMPTPNSLRAANDLCQSYIGTLSTTH